MDDRDRKTPAPADTTTPATAENSDVEAFLQHVRATPAPHAGGARGRLIFAMDATMSRQPTWDRAQHIQGEMFDETAQIGGLDVQLVYFRGFGECRASKWVSDARELARVMTKVDCRGGTTQIGRVLKHIKKEANAHKVNAAVYVGDCMEESIDRLCNAAGELGLLGIPLFMFQEGHEPGAETAFREIARLTRGAYCRFDSASAQQLRDLLSAVAVYAAGGRKALADHSRAKGGEAQLLLEQLK
ncbi:MAG: VWA domain-containing protein [Hyphomicrobiales bacterium]